ncbi:MAG: hypothetical protein HY543_06590 [Deltaproteobacteria bacterium]|nr:hypothetical protein [Deltaproteobacteria bacterium]
MDQHLKALCLAILTDRVGGEFFNRLLVETGIRLDTWEWDVANRILEKADEMRCSMLGRHETIH